MPVLLFSFNFIYAQTYTTLTQKIDSLASIGLPKSALVQVNALDRLAKKNKDVPQQIRATIYRITLLSYIDEDAINNITIALKKDIQSAAFPVKPILQSLLAELYAKYYRQNLYQLSNRPRLDRPATDLKLWDGGSFLKQITGLYKGSLQEAAREQQTPMSVLNGVLANQDSSRNLRPTLYDLLMHRAIDGFNMMSNYEAKKPSSFQLNQEVFFAANEEFADYLLKTTDTLSKDYLIIKYLQQATRFHEQQKHADAAADLYLQRLEYVHNQSSLLNNDSLYVRGLRHLIQNYAQSEVSADALSSLGNYYQQQDSLTLADSFYNQAISRYPKSTGAQNAKARLQFITRKNLSVSVESNNLPGKPLLAMVDYKNTTAAQVTVYALTQQQMKSYNALQDRPFFDGTRSRSAKLKATLHFLQDLKVVQQQQLNLPGINDLRTHKAEFKLDALPAGTYLIKIAEPTLTDSSLIQIANFSVSRLAYVTRFMGASMEMLAVNRQTGQPMPGVNVWVTKKNKPGLPERIAKGVTDKQGRLVVGDVPERQIDIELITGTDTLTSGNHEYFYNYYGRQGSYEVKNKTVFFTDRQIYRPGQVVYFKGILLKIDSNRNSVVPRESINVKLTDLNSKELNSANFTTNDFGSFAGSFTLPQSLSNGVVSLQTSFGSITLIVEEYKRPSFRVAVDPVKEDYKLNDSVKVTGLVEAFSGYGISQVRIAYHIVRKVPYIYGVRYRPRPLTEIAADTITANAAGRFTIAFKAAAEPNDVVSNTSYTYEISIDATDAAGETHTASTNVTVGKRTLNIGAVVPATVLAGDSVHIPVNLFNLNQQQQNGTLTVKLYAMHNPAKAYKNRVGANPDQHLLSREAFAAAFPDYAYELNDMKPVSKPGNALFEQSVTLTDSITGKISLAPFAPKATGWYNIVLLARGTHGDTVTTNRQFEVVAPGSRLLSIANWVVPLVARVKPGGRARFLLGANSDCHILMEKYNRGKLVLSRWLALKAGYHTQEVPLTPSERDVSVQFLMAGQNRVYTRLFPVTVIQYDNALNLRLATFRDKLQPGQKEEWKLEITAANNSKTAAELVAGMYDASLDSFAPAQPWYNALAVSTEYRTMEHNWATNYFVRPELSRALFYRYDYLRLVWRKYESLNLFGFDYNGRYNYSYRNYVRQVKALQEHDKKLEEQYRKNAALVKNGYIITGRITDGKLPLASAIVLIKGTNIYNDVSSIGTFKIKVPVGGTLVIRLVGYNEKEVATSKAANINVVLAANKNSLNEVAVVGYSVQRKTTSTSSAAIIRIDSPVGNAPVIKADMTDFGAQNYKGDPSASPTINIRGATSVGGDKKPLYVVNGAIIEGDLSGINPASILSIELLKDASATAIYGARGANGVVLVTTKPKTIIPRKNFNETAFFYPQLRTNEQGEVSISFTMPEALTQWRFKLFAHTANLNSGYLEKMLFTQKSLSISANTPRFFRAGDTITIAARLNNLTGQELKGRVNLQLFNAVNMKPVKLLLNPADAIQTFTLAGHTNQSLSFKITVPETLTALTYRLTVDAGEFTDGEENTLPVLPNRVLVTESMPLVVRGGQTRTYTFDKLVKQSSSTLVNKTLTLEYTQNPVWYAVQAIPYIMEYPYECSEQIFSRYYANSLAADLFKRQPTINGVFERWKTADSKTLLSNLEKNPELKAVLLEETPWLNDAISEAEQKKRIALLFDLNKMSYELQKNLDKIKKRQLPDGGFPWFGGDRSDPYITQYILAGMGQLYHLNILGKNNTALDRVAKKVRQYVEYNLVQRHEAPSYRKVKGGIALNPGTLHALYALSYFGSDDMGAAMKAVLPEYLKAIQRYWPAASIYEQGLAAIIMQRFGKPEVAGQITRSLLETAQHSDDMGMYWNKNMLGCYWYQSPVETQCLMIELFTETQNTHAVDELKIWLMRNKQTNNWRTTKATAQACYALLANGKSWASGNGGTLIKLGGTFLQKLKPDLRGQPGVDYTKTSWVDEQIKPGMGRVELNNTGKVVSWGALHWQYLEDMDKITSAKTGIQLVRKYFIKKQVNGTEEMLNVDAAHQPKIGDLLKVMVTLRADRDYEYVHLKDMRPAGTEPVDVLSAYKYQDGLHYYQVTKDVATNFFISWLNKGSYVFTYDLRVTQAGNFATGIASIQSMYAPEFNAHSAGQRLQFNP